MTRYKPSDIEPKWQKIWEDTEAYKATDFAEGPKTYIAEMFPYPSGAGLHVGHVRNFTIVDVLARFRKQLGENVLRPFGYDTFGLPAENYAIKTGTSPQKATETNVANFRNQAKKLGYAIDWSREINSSDPEYYKWTQEIFTKLYEKDLAYKAESFQWWCPVDQTVLANEQVEGGKCWRCGSEVEKKKMSQWFFRITAYADELLDEIDNLDWPEKIKTMQRNWIGRSQGAEISFSVLPHTVSADALLPHRMSNTAQSATPASLSESKTEKLNSIRVFTTRPDTIFGATFMVLAPEHPLVSELVNDRTRKAVDKYVTEAMRKTEVERQENKKKTGVFTGSYAINPATGEQIPIWVADYVLATYGEGAIMAVPAHDERDNEFAKKFKLPIKEVVAPHFISASNPVRADKEFTKRKAIMAVVHDPETDKFLCIKWKQQPWISFVGGGIEGDESIVDAARREVLEESGYKNLDFVRILGHYGSEFYAAQKGINRDVDFVAVLFTLKGNEQEPMSDDEKAIQEPIWLSRDQIQESDFPAYHETMLTLERMDNPGHTWTGEGRMVNSGIFDGMESSSASEEIVAWLEEQGVGKSKVTYRMRDWLISRQRYWGCPIPIAYDKSGQPHAIPADQLPVLLPDMDDYRPDKSGHSALAKNKDFLKVTVNGEEMTRETDTLDGYACSSWYLLRYTDPHNNKKAWDPKLADYWNPLDIYVGGDHAVAHLLYVRFWCKFFADEGLVNFREPVKKLLYNGYINAPDGKKMSKSKGNVIDPLEIIESGYGADTLRTYEMFIGPYELDAAWDTKAIGGVYRFLNRAWTVTQEYLAYSKSQTGSSQVFKDTSSDLLKAQHATTRRVTDDLHRNSFNTAIAALMEYVNELYKLKTDGFSQEWQEALEVLVKLLAPFAPHISAELFEQLGHKETIESAGWPKWDEKYLVADEAEVVVQVNGKLRAKFTVAAEQLGDEETVKKLALDQENVQNFTRGKEVVRTIYIQKNKLVNVVVK